MASNPMFPSPIPVSYTHLDVYKRQVGDILRLIEGSLAPVACLEDDPNTCPRCSECATLAVWEKLYQAINQVVDSYTLQDLLEIEKQKLADANNFVI